MIISESYEIVFKSETKGNKSETKKAQTGHGEFRTLLEMTERTKEHSLRGDTEFHVREEGSQ